MTSDARLRLEPVVSWPRAMTAGRPHLVAVDLRLAGPSGKWPYEEEEFAFTCLLDGSRGFTVAAVRDATVIVHRFGGSYGPAEFVVTPEPAPGPSALLLTIVTPRGVMVRTTELPVSVRSGPPAGVPVPARPILTPVPVVAGETVGRYYDDIGLGEGDTLRVVLDDPGAAGPGGGREAPSLWPLLVPNAHLIIDGDGILGRTESLLMSRSDAAEALLADLSLLAARTSLEITCSLGYMPEEFKGSISAPRGVRVMFHAPGGLGHLVSSLVHAERAGRTVVVVSPGRIADVARRAGADHLAHDRFLRDLALLIPPGVALFLVLDRSLRMVANGGLDLVNAAIPDMIRDLRDALGERASRVSLGVVTFAEDARWHLAYPTPLDELRWPRVTAGGDAADVGAALHLLTRLGRAPWRKRYASDHVESRPLVVLVSGGPPTYDWRSLRDELLAVPLGRSMGTDPPMFRMAIALGTGALSGLAEEFVNVPGHRPRVVTDFAGLRAALAEVGAMVENLIGDAPAAGTRSLE